MPLDAIVWNIVLVKKIPQCHYSVHSSFYVNPHISDTRLWLARHFLCRREIFFIGGSQDLVPRLGLATLLLNRFPSLVWWCQANREAMLGHFVKENPCSGCINPQYNCVQKQFGLHPLIMPLGNPKWTEGFQTNTHLWMSLPMPGYK